jgi:hypothetical protein
LQLYPYLRKLCAEMVANFINNNTCFLQVSRDWLNIFEHKQTPYIHPTSCCHVKSDYRKGYNISTLIFKLKYHSHCSRFRNNLFLIYTSVNLNRGLSQIIPYARNYFCFNCFYNIGLSEQIRKLNIIVFWYMMPCNSVQISQNVRRHIPEGSNHHSPRHEDLKSHNSSQLNPPFSETVHIHTHTYR